jgi:autotransporter-associated beta strand protein
MPGTTLDLGGNTLTTGDATGANTIGGTIQGAGGSLVKVGSDTLTLLDVDTYTGPTTVSAGSLLVNGSLTSAVAVATGATLGGSGTVGNVSSISSNSGTVNPGNGATDATFTIGSFVLGTGTLFLNIDGTAAYDSVKVTGSSINLTGTNLTLAITPANINTGDQYTILSNPGNLAITGSFVGAAEGSTITVSGRSFMITYHGGASTNDIVLTAQAAGAVTIVGGFPSLNANPHNDPQYAYIAHTGQHSMVESVVYSFGSSVSLSRSDFTITNKGAASIGSTVFPAFVPDLVVTGTDSNTLWTVTFANHVIGGVEQADGVNDVTHSIGDGKYEIVLNNAASSLNSTYDFYRLLGDVNHSGVVDGANFQAFITAFNQTPGTALYLGAEDFDGGYLNPTVNGADFQTLVTNFNRTVMPIAGFN